jgi:AcrR family transcriptional regulator
VYRHFRNKSELLRAVGDRLLVDVTDNLPGNLPGNTAWRSTVVTVCLRLRDALLKQPHLATAVRDAPPLQAGEFAITETLLQQFLQLGLSDEDAALAYHSVIELTVGSAAIDATVDALDDADREGRYDRWRQAYSALPIDQYPAARAVADSLYRGTAAQRFTIALDRLLDGIALSA